MRSTRHEAIPKLPSSADRGSILTGELAKLKREKRASDFAIATLFTLAIASSFWADQVAKDDLYTEFKAEAAGVVAHLQRKIDGYEKTLLATTGLFNSSDEVTRDEFHKFFESIRLEANVPGIAGIAYVKRLPAADKVTYLEWMKQQFAGMDWAPSLKIYPRSDNDESFVFTFVEPIHGNKEVIGFDAGTDDARMEAIHRAAKKNGLVVSQAT
ncbi:MAG: CHASE domain-containing protein [Deltaproteobacteria bacterium]|nr:CHASE domain-containing protein [Deltaproteobacteria bacterium]